jgi:hypothetical protein
MKFRVGYLIILGALIFIGLAGSGHLSSSDSVFLVSKETTEEPSVFDLFLKGAAVLVVGVALAVVLKLINNHKGGDQ